MVNQLPSGETLAERVKRLREAKGLSQNELADKADLAPAALSRILAGKEDGGREPRMEHILALAEALQVTATELVAGTTAEGVLVAWVPRDRFDASETARVAAQNERDLARAEIAARVAEVDVLRSTNADQGTRIEALERELVQARAEVVAARQVRTDLTNAQREAATARAGEQRASVMADRLRDQLAVSQFSEANVRWQLHEAVAQVSRLQRELQEAKDGRWTLAGVSAGLGAILAAAASTPKTRKTPTRSKRTTRRSR